MPEVTGILRDALRERYAPEGPAFNPLPFCQSGC